MTPQEISDYKLKWRPGIRVAIHSDLRSQAKDWCKLWLMPHHWTHVKWTGPYEDEFRFEKVRYAKGLVEKFPEYAKIIEKNC